MTDQEFEKFAKEQELNSIGDPYEIRQVCESYKDHRLKKAHKELIALERRMENTAKVMLILAGYVVYDVLSIILKP